MRSALILFILALGLSAFAQSAPEPVATPKHYIVFIHGIGGSDQSFGVMPAAIVKHMDERQPGTMHSALVFTYPTADESLDTDDFAILLGKFIDSQIGPALGTSDKISFVAHSQGGLVATIWYFHASQGRKRFFPRYSKYVDALITLGTPFWGSKVATVLSTGKFQGLKKQIQLHMNTGKAQLTEMSLGSRTNINFRKNVMQTREGAFSAMFKRIRPLNMAGMANISSLLAIQSHGLSVPLEWLKPLIFGGNHLESDTMVSVASARFDSIYSQDLREEYDAGSYDKTIQPITTNYSPFVIVSAIHASPMADEIYDLSYLPNKCMAIADCDHPTYFYVLNHLLGRPVRAFSLDVPKNELAGISLSFRVDLDPTMDASEYPPKVELVSLEANSAVEFIMEPKNEFMSSFEFIHPTKKYIFEKHYSGYFKYLKKSGPEFEKARWQGLKAYFKISAPFHKPKIVETLLLPTYSTFVEAKLTRKPIEMRATPGSSLGYGNL